MPAPHAFTLMVICMHIECSMALSVWSVETVDYCDDFGCSLIIITTSRRIHVGESTISGTTRRAGQTLLSKRTLSLTEMPGRRIALPGREF